MLEVVRHPVAYFLTMIVVFSAASLPPSPPTLMAAKDNHPVLLAALGAIAAGIAACLDWYLVRRVFRIGALTRVRRSRLFDRAERWAKVAPFLTVLVFAALPLPFVIVRVLMPVTGYPLLRYAIAIAIGRFPRVLVIAAFGQAFDIPRWVLEILFAAGIGVALITAILRKLGYIDRPTAGPRAGVDREPPPRGEPPTSSS